MSKSDKLAELEHRITELEQQRSPQITQADVEAYLDELPVSRRQLLGAVAAGTVSLPLLYADIARAQQGGDGDPYACVWLGDQDANDFALDNLGSLNGADIANATSGQVIESDGDGTLSFGADDTGGGGATGGQLTASGLSQAAKIEDDTKLKGVQEFVIVDDIIFAACVQDPGRVVSVRLEPDGGLTLLDDIQLPSTSDWAATVAYNNGHIFAFDDSSSSQCEVIDVRNPGSLSSQGSITPSNGPNGYFGAVPLGDYILATGHGGGDNYQVYDASDPTNPTNDDVVASTDLSVSSGVARGPIRYPYWLRPDKNGARIPKTNVTDPLNPSWDGSFTMSTTLSGGLNSAALSGELLVATASSDDLVSAWYIDDMSSGVDVSNEDSVTDSTHLVNARDCVIVGDKILVANDDSGSSEGKGGVGVVDASDPQNLSVDGSIRNTDMWGCARLDVHDGQVIAACGGFPKKSDEGGQHTIVRLDINESIFSPALGAGNIRAEHVRAEAGGYNHLYSREHRTVHEFARQLSIESLLRLPTREADPTASELGEGYCALYVSDGSGDCTGSDGDIILAVNNGGTVTASVFLDNSAGTDLTELASLTAKDTGTVDSTYGTSEADVIKNNRTRIDELESRVSTLGFIP